jgi:hypothetical protein
MCLWAPSCECRQRSPMFDRSQTYLCQHNKPNDTTRASIPFDSLSKRTLDKLDALRLRHSRPPIGVAITIDVGRTTSANGIILLVKGSSERNAVNLSAPPVIIPRNNHSRTELVLVIVAQFPEDGSGVLCCGGLARRRGEILEVVMDNVGNGLCVRSGSRTTAPYRVVHLCELVSHPIGDIGTGRSAAVCSKDDAVVEFGRHTGSMLEAG